MLENQNPKEDEETPTPEGTEDEGTSKKTDDTAEETPADGGAQPNPEEDQVDYKKKFSESSREAQRLLDETKRLEGEKTELESKLEQSNENSFDDELSKKYPNWDEMTETEQTIVRNQEKLDQRLAVSEEEKAWEKDYLKAKEEFPQLKEFEDDFKTFCYKYPRSVDASTLAPAFLRQKGVSLEKQETPDRIGLEKSTGGTKPDKQAGQYSQEDIKRLRDADYEKYLKLVKNGRIKAKDIV